VVEVRESAGLFEQVERLRLGKVAAVRCYGPVGGNLATTSLTHICS
jgi:hypothetical protein